MTDFPPLSSLGDRIMIMGPTNAGKSTLAVAISNTLSIPAIHLDAFRHLPNTDWQQRPTSEFHALHDEAITGDAWVIDGNYSRTIPQRLARATGIILIDDALWRRYYRYFRRTLGHGERLGALDGNKDTIKWAMLHWLWHTRNSVAKYQRMSEQSGLPYVFIPNEQALQALYRAWHLTHSI